jgi:hypothetical protein
MLGPATILHDDGKLQLACAKDVFIERWVINAGAPQQKALFEHHRAFVAKGTGAWSVLFVDLRFDTVTIPSEEERELIRQRQAMMAPKLAAGVMVIANQGFVASMVRTIFSAAVLAQRTPYEYRVCASTKEGWEWLAPRRKVPAAELMGAAALEAWYAELLGRLSTSAAGP